MIFVTIPFKQKNKEDELVIEIKGGHHPYHVLDEETGEYDIIKQTIRLNRWDHKKDFLAPEWAAEITIRYGMHTAKMKCEGRDVFLNMVGPIQRMHHRNGSRATNSTEFNKKRINKENG